MSERIIRPSSLTTYADCPRRFAARHLRRDVTEAGYELQPAGASTAGALVGSGVHAGAAWTLEQKRDGGGTGAEGDAIERAIEGFRDRAAAEGAEWDDTTPSPNTAEKQIARMVKVFRARIAPRIEPVQVEERLEVTIEPGWVLSGQVDALTAGLADDGQTVRDTKTGVRRRANGAQYGAYSIILQSHGFAPTQLVEDFIARVPLKHEQPMPEAVEFDYHASRMDAWDAVRAIIRDTAEFQARVLDPNGEAPHGAFRANPASNLCSARWCPAHGSRWCRSHRPEKG